MATRTKAKAATKSKSKAQVKTVAKKAPVKAKAVAKKVAPKAKTTQKTAVKKTASAAKAVRQATKPVAKPVAKLVSKVAKPAAKPVAKAAPVTIAAKPVERKTLDRAPQMKAPIASVAKAEAKAPVTAVAKKANFGVGEYVVYPTHGVGKILGLESEKIGDYELKVFVIAFEKDKMTLRVPVGRAEAAGLRAISPNDQISRAITTLKGRAKIARGMWSRRAQEYEAKINSGNLIAIAEVVRDLHKNVDQSERSYSERMIYETAMHRLCGEVAASERVELKEAQDKLLKVLRKQAA